MSEASAGKASSKSAAKHAVACEPGSCEHCGALVYGDSVKCSQCGRFPIKLHKCPRCGSISSREEERCWKCRRPFEPGGDFF